MKTNNPNSITTTIKYNETVQPNSELLSTLCSLFSNNIAQYKSSQYDEANTRTNFIDKFFALLDWDITNNQGFSESYRDVVREDKVKIDGAQKAPDYSFRIGGLRKFFVEAKKPSVNIKDAAEPAYQIRRYAYTAKLPLSILTNFAEFAVYDTRIKPGKDDKASTARIFYCTFDQYQQHFDFIYNTFSKNAILKGSFDRYVEENKNKKGTEALKPSEVDTELLALVEKWRIELAKNIAKNNLELSVYNLNTVVQKIIDRIIFLRIAEDRGIEDENLLLSVAKTTNIYEKLIHIFAKANSKYNSGLFACIDWIDNVRIDDKVLASIIVNLYYPECPYEFSVLPIEILGSIYERFLGKTIRLRTAKGETQTAVIEEKPEIKKAGGVFYTPQYIVDYIVQNTVGEKINNKTPEEISGIRICDPACGSGSFLVGAYQYLLNYHLDYYTQPNNIKSALKTSKIYEAAYQSYKLTIEEKQRILVNCIFGVDIDNQAVEVSKLSLYLKLLEDEGRQASEQLFKHSDLAILPSLEANIKCGNSLIGTDFYSWRELELTDEERIKVNCFDWEKEFGGISHLPAQAGKDTEAQRTQREDAGSMEAAVLNAMEFAKQTPDVKYAKDGIFDIVIGNPPFVSIRTLSFESMYKNYFKNKFKLAIGQYDLYVLFTEMACSLLTHNGYYGFIIPKRMASNENFSEFRKFLLKELPIIIYSDVGKVFADASVEANVIICSKAYKGNIIHIEKLNREKQFIKDKEFQYKAIKELPFNIFSFNNDIKVIKLLKKIKENSGLNFGSICNITRGFECGFNNPLITKTKGKYPIIKGEHISRYKILATEYWVKPDFKNQGKIFKKPEIFIKVPKLLTKFVSNKLEFALDEIGYCNTNVVYNIHFSNDINLFYILGILNSTLTNFWFNKTFANDDKIFPHIQKNQLESIPLPTINKTIHDNLVSLVDKMLELKQKEAAEINQQLKTMISRQIEGVDKAIDKCVYELYNLTEDEIRVVEGQE